MARRKDKETGTLVVTGGGGFVMANLVRRYLESCPDARCLMIDRSPLDRAAKRFFEPVEARLDVCLGDVSDPTFWQDLDPDPEIAYVVHGAAVTSINRLLHTRGPGRPGLSGARGAIQTNVLGTLEALAWAGRLPKLRRFINVSSGSAYGSEGPKDRPLPEVGFLAPEGLYPLSKFAGEGLTRVAGEALELPAVSVRLSGVYGPLDRATESRNVQAAPLKLARAALDSKVLRLRTLEAQGDFIHAGDVAEALIALLQARKLRHPVYNIAYGERVKLGDLAAMIRDRYPQLACQEVPRGRVDITLEASQDRGRWGAYDISRIERDTGWRPRPQRTALFDYLDWLMAEEQT